MKHSRLIQVLAIIALSLLFIGCTGVGIYSVVAVTPKLQTGNLPDGLSAMSVVAPSSMTGASGDYAFFSSGPGIWVRRVTAPVASKWTSISMPIRSGSNPWDGVQSMAATDDRIYFALYDYDSENSSYTVGLFYVNAYTASTSTLTFNQLEVWTSDSNGYKTLELFAPRNNRVFVNILQHDNTYNSLEIKDGEKGFTSSQLFRLANTATAWTAATEITSASLNGPTDGRYVTGVADNGAGTVRISATAFRASTDKGVLLDGNGNLVSVKGATALPALNAVTWLPNVRGGAGDTGSTGAFIVAATALSGSTYPVYVSTDGSTWYTVGGTTTSVLVTGFADISTASAAQTDSARTVLVATSSYIDGTKKYKAPLGYFELNTAPALTADNNWSLTTAWKSFKFADINTYGASKLKSSSILGMTVVGNDLYAVTRSKGVWKAPNIQGGSAVARPVWAPE